MSSIPFNRPYMTGNEIDYILGVKQQNMLSGDGVFTRQCNKLLEANVGARKALLTHSCTAALEMAALLIDTQPGDEIVMPLILLYPQQIHLFCVVEFQYLWTSVQIH